MRDQIIAAAMDEISEFGIKFTMNDIVKRLSISKSTLYAHFKSKEDLIGAIVDLTLESMRQQENEILNNNTLNVCEKLKTLLVIQPSMDISIRLMLELKRHFPNEWHKCEQHRIEKWQIIESLANEGISIGYFRSIDLTILRILFDGAMKELTNQSFFIHNTISFTESINKMTDILFRGIIKTHGSDEV